MSLCKYRNALGVPNKGFHKYQAIGDWIGTIILALIFSGITYYFSNRNIVKNKLPFPFILFLWFVGFILLAMFLHYIFCVKSRVNVFFGLVK